MERDELLDQPLTVARFQGWGLYRFAQCNFAASGVEEMEAFMSESARNLPTIALLRFCRVDAYVVDKLTTYCQH